MARKRVRKLNRKSQSSIEYISTFSMALLILIVAVVAVGAFFLRSNQTTYAPSVCIISSQLNCVQAAIANNSGKSVAMVVFTNNLGVPITFAGNSIVVYPSSSQQGYIGSCYPTTAPAGATVICNATLTNFKAQIGQQLQSSFQISYSQCSSGQCQVTNTTGTSAVSVTKSIATSSVELITFPAGEGGISVDGNEYPSGTQINFLTGANYSIYADVPTDPDPSFEGWITTGGLHVKSITSQATTSWANSSGSIEAAFACYSLMFLSNPSVAGSEAANPTSTGLCPTGEYLPSATPQITATPSSPYWTFTSWGSSTGGYSGSSNPATLPAMNSNVTDTATYSRCYTIAFGANPVGTGSEAINEQSSGTCTTGYYETGTTGQITATPINYWIFDGWNGIGSGSYTGTANPATVTFNANLTEVADYQQCYILSLQASPSGAGTESASPQESTGCPSGSYIYGAQVTLTATSTYGYAFGSWSGTAGSSTSNPYAITITGPTTETANYNYCYALTLAGSPSSGGSEYASPTQSTGCPSYTYIQGTQVTVTSSPNYGYAFGSWSGTYSSGANPYSITINGATTEIANYNPCYSVSVSGNPSYGGSESLGSSGSCIGGLYLYGTSVYAYESPGGGWYFSGWGGSGSGSYSGGANPAPITVYSGISEVANYYSTTSTTTSTIPYFSVSVSQYPGGSDTAVSGSGTYQEGSPVSISTWDGANYWQFAGWSGNAPGCGGSEDCTFTMPGYDVSETANWNPCVWVYANSQSGAACSSGRQEDGAGCVGTGSAQLGCVGNTGYTGSGGYECYTFGSQVNLINWPSSSLPAGCGSTGPGSHLCSWTGAGNDAYYTCTTYTQGNCDFNLYYYTQEEGTFVPQYQGCSG